MEVRNVDAVTSLIHCFHYYVREVNHSKVSRLIPLCGEFGFGIGDLYVSYLAEYWDTWHFNGVIMALVIWNFALRAVDEDRFLKDDVSG